VAAQGVPNAGFARRVGVSRPTVIQWRNRYDAGGISALAKWTALVVRRCRRRRGGRRNVQAPPEPLGVTHWSGRLLGKHLGIFVRVGGPDLAGMESAAVAARDVQVIHQARVGRQGSWMWSGCFDPQQGGGGRSVSKKSRKSRRWTGPRRSYRSAPGCSRKPPTTTCATALPSCSRSWRWRPGRSPMPATRATLTPSSWRFSNGSQTGRQGLAEGAVARRWPTTTPPTNTRPFNPTWLAKRPRFISPRPPDRG
jgi:hypothetical protein